MNGRRLATVMLLLVLLAICFVSAPVFSGEHPWDADLVDVDKGGDDFDPFAGGDQDQDTLNSNDETPEGPKEGDGSSFEFSDILDAAADVIIWIITN